MAAIETMTGTITKTALAEKLTASAPSIHLAEYSGAETITVFGDVKAEFTAITGTVGAYDLGWRGKVRVTGEDRGRWLNGMVTNNVKDLKLNHGNYNFLLNAQGRIQGDMYIYDRGEYLLIDTERSQVEHLLETLNHFIIMDDVELTDVSETITSIGVQGPGATALLKIAGIEPISADPQVVCDLTWKGINLSVTRMVSEDYLTYEFWVSPENVRTLWDALIAAGATPTGTEALETFRVLAGVPKYGIDIRDKNLPQETEQKQALNFTKGCYIGQEIVERIRSQGNVHRMFSGFVLNGEAAPGSKVIVNEREVGELTSVARVPLESGEKLLALGYIRREFAGSQLKIGETTATTASLPFKF